MLVVVNTNISYLNIYYDSLKYLKARNSCVKDIETKLLCILSLGVHATYGKCCGVKVSKAFSCIA